MNALTLRWLKEFCLMYHEYKRQAYDIRTMDKTGCVCDPRWSDSTGNTVCRSESARSKIQLIESCCKLAAGDKWESLLLAVTEDIPCEMLGVKSCELQSFLVFLSRKLQRVEWKKGGT